MIAVVEVATAVIKHSSSLVCAAGNVCTIVAGPTAALVFAIVHAWVIAVITLLVGLLMLIFILQNGASQPIAFLWLHFTVPLGVGFLLAGVLGGLLVVLIGIARIGQIRLAARRHARAEHPRLQPPV